MAGLFARTGRVLGGPLNPMWWRRFSAKKPERRITRPAPAPWGNQLRPNPSATRPPNRPAARPLRHW